MRSSSIFLVATLLLGSSAIVAKPPVPGPLKCTTTGGESADPYFGVIANQNLMMPVKRKNLTVSGQYRLNMRTGTVKLVKAVPQGTNPKILLLNLRVIASGKGGHCLPMKEMFEAKAGQYTQVTIKNRGGRSITVDVKTSH
jgi:hypothetical protein